MEIVSKCNNLIQKILLEESDINQYFNPTVLDKHEWK